MKNSKSISGGLFLVLGLCSWAGAQEVAIQKGRTEFVAVGKPAMLKIRGETQGPQGNLTFKDVKVSGNIKLDLQKLNTGIDLRDEHMKKKYLQVELYPMAELTLQDFTLPMNVSEIKKKIADQKFTAMLKLHGVSKPVDGTYDVEPQGKNLKVHATYRLKLSDFNIEIPSYAGLKVADSVDIETFFEVAQ